MTMSPGDILIVSRKRAIIYFSMHQTEIETRWLATTIADLVDPHTYWPFPYIGDRPVTTQVPEGTCALKRPEAPTLTVTDVCGDPCSASVMVPLVGNVGPIGGLIINLPTTNPVVVGWLAGVLPHAERMAGATTRVTRTVRDRATRLIPASSDISILSTVE